MGGGGGGGGDGGGTGIFYGGKIFFPSLIYCDQRCMVAIFLVDVRFVSFLDWTVCKLYFLWITSLLFDFD